MEKLNEKHIGVISRNLSEIQTQTELLALILGKCNFNTPEEEINFYSVFVRAIKKASEEIDLILNDPGRRLALDFPDGFLDWADEYFHDRFDEELHADPILDNMRHNSIKHSYSIYTVYILFEKWCELRGYHFCRLKPTGFKILKDEK